MSTFRKTIISEIRWDSVVAAVVVSWQHLSTFGIVYKTSVFLNFSAENQWKKFDFCLPKIILLQIYYIPSSDMIFKVKKQPKNEAKSAHFRAVFCLSATAKTPLALQFFVQNLQHSSR